MNFPHTRRQIWINIKKEVWEFQKTLIWTPTVIVGVILIVAIFELLTLSDYQSTRIYEGFEYLQTKDNFYGFSEVMLTIMQTLMVPFMLIALVIQVHYCLSCLFDDRKDLSVYFWRSLPVSDKQTVGVKLLVALFVVPGIFLLAGTLLQLLIGIGFIVLGGVLSIAYDISLWNLLGNSGFFTNILRMWWTVVPFILWLFPVFAWLMLASCMAKRSPFLIAVLPAIAIILSEVLMHKTFGVGSLFFTDAILNYFSLFSGLDGISTISSSQNGQSFEYVNNSPLPFYLADIFANKISLIATILGVIFISAALWMRKNKAH